MLLTNIDVVDGKQKKKINQTFILFTYGEMRDEFYIRTLLALYQAKEISLDKLWSLLKEECWNLNPVVRDNIERLRSKSKYNFIANAYKEIVENRTDW